MLTGTHIFNELKELDSSELINLERKNIYHYPEGYFNDLPENIIRQVWLQSISTIMPYAVPYYYFENLPDLILDKLAIQTKQLTAITSEELYQAPAGYFDTLAGNILQKIKKENADAKQELEDIAPLLSKIPKTNVYTVPDGYFESQNFVQQKNAPAKVISITGKSRKWITYMAAACVTAVMFLGGYFYYAGNFSGNSKQNQLANINVQTAISRLSDSTIDNYLQNDNADFYVNQNTDGQDLNIQTLIKNTTDQEIENYLIQNPDAGEKPEGI